MSSLTRITQSNKETMNITERENELFAIWAKEKGYGTYFVKDGVPCPDQYVNAKCVSSGEKCRICFVLKEAIAEGEENFDMRKWIDYYGGQPQTWDNIARWTQAILEGGGYPDSISENDRFKWLKQISFLNLKKLGGPTTSNPTVIRKFAYNDRVEIRKQLQIYQPDIIICCGKLGNKSVADCVHDWILDHKEDDWNHSLGYAYKGCCYFYTKAFGKTTAVLDCYHPSNFSRYFDDEAIYTAIKSIIPLLLI